MKRIAVMLFVCACGSSPPASPDASAPPIDATATPDGHVDSFTGNITDENLAPIADAKICVLDHPDVACATTGANGDYTFALPDLHGQQLAVEVTATDHLSQIRLVTEAPAAVWPSGWHLQTDATAMTEMSTKAGFTFPGEGTGFLIVQADGSTGGSLSGATVSISPKSGKGPVYWDASGPNPTLTATTAAARAASFGDLAPGRYQVTVTAPQKTCTVSPNGTLFATDWAPSGANTTDVQIAADAETLGVFVTCL
jgi:hypothetical protein